jgi:hypothetical protein
MKRFSLSDYPSVSVVGGKHTGVHSCIRQNDIPNGFPIQCLAYRLSPMISECVKLSRT